MPELVHLDVAGGIARISLDSPENRNALSTQLPRELEAAVRAALADDGVRVIVLTATGTVFCSGADLREQRQRNEAGEASALGGPGGGLPAILTLLWESPKPVVGRINGPARAGGLGLVAACDLAVAVDVATFGFSEVRLGLIPAIVSVVCVPKLGEARALELFLTGEPFTAAQAGDWGLLTAAVPAEELDATIDRYVASLLKAAPPALAGAKQLVRRIPTMSMADAFAWASSESARFFASEEAHEGMAAFAEKRPPRWAG
jgi:methylglutaconyl-CoA hydratase